MITINNCDSELNGTTGGKANITGQAVLIFKIKAASVICSVYQLMLNKFLDQNLNETQELSHKKAESGNFCFILFYFDVVSLHCKYILF